MNQRATLLEGSLEDIELTSMVQTVSVSRRSIAVELRDNGGAVFGTLVLKAGQIVSAVSEGLSGLDAVRKLVSARRPGRFLVYRAGSVDLREHLGPVGDVLTNVLAPAQPAAGAARAVLARGDLGQFGVRTILDTLGLGRQRLAVELFAADGARLGALELKAGQLLSASCGEHSGEAAARALLELKAEGRFEVFKAPDAGAVRPLLPLRALLNPSAREDGLLEVEDEDLAEAEGEDAPGSRVAPRPAPAQGAARSRPPPLPSAPPPPRQSIKTGGSATPVPSAAPARELSSGQPAANEPAPLREAAWPIGMPPASIFGSRASASALPPAANEPVLAKPPSALPPAANEPVLPKPSALPPAANELVLAKAPSALPPAPQGASGSPRAPSKILRMASPTASEGAPDQSGDEPFGAHSKRTAPPARSTPPSASSAASRAEPRPSSLPKAELAAAPQAAPNGEPSEALRARYSAPAPELKPPAPRQITGDAINGRSGSGRPQAPIIAVTSPKGGAGRSTLSLNLAVSLARRGRRVVLVDADASSLQPALNLAERQLKGVADVLEGRAALGDALLDTRVSGLKLMPSGELGEASYRHPGWQTLLASLAQQADLVLVDCPPAWYGATLSVLGAASHQLLVLAAEPAARKACTAYLARLQSLSSARPALLGLVINLLDYQVHASVRALEELSNSEHAQHVFDVPIPRSPVFMEASARGVPIVHTEQGAAPTVAWVFETLATALLERLLLERPIFASAPLLA